MATKVLAGRKWKRSRDGKNTISVKYCVEQQSALPVGSEGGNLAGVPKPKDEHPSDDKLIVASVDYEEQDIGKERFVIATVNYEPKDSESSSVIEEEETIKYQVDEWGFSAETSEKELLNDVRSTQQDPMPVVNSAGDPFDSVPKVSVYTPVFTKVMKWPMRRGNALGFNGKVNSGEVTIGGMTFPPATLLCSVAEKRIFGDPDWNYQYTVQLKYKSNIVKIFGEDNSSELGWDVGIVDAGMRQLDRSDDDLKRKVLIRQIDGETGQECVVSSPTLLDGHGFAISPTDEDQSPRNLRFQAYVRGEFPAWFYSEPPIVRPEPEPEEES